MNEGRIVKSSTLAIGVALFITALIFTNTQSAQSISVPQPKTAASVDQAMSDAQSSDDFAGMTFTDEQKAEIEKINQESESYKYKTVSDSKLSEDQKNAMLLGYTRLEYSRKLKVLTPEQQRAVRQRFYARRAAEQAQHKSPAPRQ